MRQPTPAPEEFSRGTTASNPGTTRALSPPGDGLARGWSFVRPASLAAIPLFNTPGTRYVCPRRVLSLSFEASILVAYLFEREPALRLVVA